MLVIKYPIKSFSKVPSSKMIKKKFVFQRRRSWSRKKKKIKSKASRQNSRGVIRIHRWNTEAATAFPFFILPCYVFNVFDGGTQCGILEFYSHYKKFVKPIHSNLVPIALISRNFCKEMVRVDLLNFHTVGYVVLVVCWYQSNPPLI